MMRGILTQTDNLGKQNKKDFDESMLKEHPDFSR